MVVDQQGLAGEAGGGVGETVSEVEPGLVPSLAVAAEGVGGDAVVGVGEGDDRELELLQEAGEEGWTSWPVAIARSRLASASVGAPTPACDAEASVSINRS